MPPSQMPSGVNNYRFTYIFSYVIVRFYPYLESVVDRCKVVVDAMDC